MLDRHALLDLQEIIGGSRADLQELIADFLEDAAIQLEDMAKAARGSDAETVRRIAHSLKSNARDLGAGALAQLCAGLERDLNTPGLAVDLSAMVTAILAMWPQVRTALEAEIAESEVPS